MYCKGTEEVTHAILGPLGTAVSLKFARIVDNKRVTFKASLIREMKATVDPMLAISNSDSNTAGVNTRKVFLECLQSDAKKSEQPQAAAGSGHFSDHTPQRGHTGALRAAFEDHVAAASTPTPSPAMTDGASSGRRVFFEGKWYSEDEIEQLEKLAKSIDAQILELEDTLGNGTSSAGAAGRPPDRACAATYRAPSPEEEPEVTNEGMIAAIFVVQGGSLQTCKKGIGGFKWRSVKASISTGGLMTWGTKADCRGQAIWARAKSEQYDPSMNKTSFDFLNRKFEVMFEAREDLQPIVAFSIDGGTVQAAQSKSSTEFVAPSEAERDKWVLGVNSVITMVRRENRLRSIRRADSVRSASALPQLSFHTLVTVA